LNKAIGRLISVVYCLAAFILIVIALLIIGWTVWKIFVPLRFDENLSNRLLQFVGAIIISIAVIDVAKYIIEEEIIRDKELRSPEEARKTLTKIFVIISIAVSLEGLVFIFKAGTEDLTLLPYPSFLILTAILAIIGLGIYQKFSTKTEKETQKIEKDVRS